MIDNKDITVLYVDDEDINLFLFSANFKNKFNIITSLSGRDALEKLEENHDSIIVVISDLRMPLMTGLEFIEKAKAKYKNIFYYILTAFDYNSDIENALKNKTIQKFFTKPFDAKEIEETILEAVSGLAK
jgi:response regulator RpfG family c-di-GMP phosphodiesterase